MQPPIGPRRAFDVALALVTVALIGASCTGSQPATAPRVRVRQPTQAQMAAAGLAALPTAPADTRVDLTVPPFSHPTRVTNPLFPISDLRSAVLDGRIDGKPFHTETTLLPYTRPIEWSPGHTVDTLVSQYAAWLDGRIQEVALDYYAQADDGSVWYFGEDVSDYDPHGVIAFTTDSWLAGRDGPPAMIMPGHPTVGQAFRTENIPGKVFEQVTVKSTGDTEPGPLGAVSGAMIGTELHDDGAQSDKVFAPGYGEFLTRDSDGVEAMAVAVPTDAVPGPTPADLARLESGGLRALDAVARAGWASAARASKTLTFAWKRYRTADTVPVRLVEPMDRALFDLAHAVDARSIRAAETASIDVAQAALDLELPFRPPVEIDVARFGLWTRQLIVDASAGDLGAASGDMASLEITRDRFASAIDPVELTTINRELLTMREDQVDARIGAVVRGARGLLRDAASLTPA